MMLDTKRFEMTANVKYWWGGTGIRTRLALVILAITFLTGIITSTGLQSIIVKRYTEIVTSKMEPMIAEVARGIDDQLKISLKMLAEVAKVTPDEILHDSVAATHFLKNRTGIASIFDNGLVLFDRNGHLIAETPDNPDRTIWSFSSYPFFQQAIAAGAPVISAPFRSTKPPYRPVIQFLAPVRNKTGMIIGFLSGGITLDRSNFIGALAQRKIGRDGYLYLYSHDRVMLVHPDQQRLLKKDIQLGVNRLFDQAITGWSGSGTTINSRGMKQVATFVHLKEVPWILAAAIPADQFFAPMHANILFIASFLAFVAFVAIAISLRLISKVSEPLSQIAEHLQNLPQRTGDERLLKISGGGYEIKTLTENFNRMIQSIGQEMEERYRITLKNQETLLLLRRITDNVPDLIWAKDLQNRYLFSNRANNNALLFGFSVEESIGKTHDQIISGYLTAHEDDPTWYCFSDLCARSDSETLITEQSMQFYEEGVVMGQRLCLDVYKAPLYDADNTLIGTVGSARIVNREKQLEAETLRLSRLYRTLSLINQKITHKPETLELMQFVCDTLVDDDNFVMAWVGLPDGAGGYFPASTAGITIEELLHYHAGKHCSSLAENEKTSQIIASIDPLNPVADLCPHCLRLWQFKRFGSLATYLIEPFQGMAPILTLYAKDHFFFDDAEKKLMEELTEDLVFALQVSEQRRKQHLAAEELKLAAMVFENSSEGMALTDQYERILMVNRAFTETTGYTADEVIGQTPRMLKSNRHGRDFYQVLWQSLKVRGQWRGEIWNRRKNGEIYPEILAITVIKDEQGEPKNYLALSTDISSLKDTEQRLEYLSWNDPLTGLPNRQMAVTLLEQSIIRAKRAEKCGAILCLDLDQFKDVNDSFGHLTGDALLKKVAERLRNRMRGSDTVARLGGDEFLVLLDELDDHTIPGVLADDLIATMSEPFVLDAGLELRIGLSCGVALFPHHGETALELMQKADAALNSAKQAGRSCFAFYSEELTSHALERIQLGNRLRRAVELDELMVYFQPQVDIASGCIVGAEALMRWEAAGLGMISPARFIPLAEENGCIIDLGRWILRQTCLYGRIWLDAGLPPITLAVNLSPRQFRQRDIVDLVADILESTGFPASLLELEITESTMMEHEDQAIAQLNRLRNLGVRLAMDDFGTGYSSLAYLKHFPLHLLKIDKSFVDDIPHGKKDLRLVDTIIMMAKGMQFKVLAEGVERQEQ